MSRELAIREFLITSFLPDVAPDEIAGDDDLLASGVIDSLGLLTLISWVEEHFSISVEDDDLSPDKFSSVDAICAYVDGALASSAAS
jgi:acyl carrier protein